MVAYAIWATNSKSEVRSDLRGHLEAVVASERLMEVLNLLLLLNEQTEAQAGKTKVTYADCLEGIVV